MKNNIISFSLWGNNWDYVQGAIENCELAKEIYPDWKCRVYYDDTVSKVVISRLKKLDVELFERPRNEGTKGMMWRFEVAMDESVDKFMIRDTDSRLSNREKVAVDEWINSGLPYHIMRDHPAHGTEILGGMWGGTVGHISNFKHYFDMYYSRGGHSYGFDQSFLRDCIWPNIINDHIAHDEFFKYTGNEKQFPCTRIDGEFIGKPVRSDWV